MNQCIKCGVEIPEGELFCIECSLNPGVTMFEERPSDRIPLPIGKMQTPIPMKKAKVQNVPVPQPATKKSSSKGLVAALVIVSLLLALVVGLVVWQYSDIRVEKNRIRAKEADLSLRLGELDDLQMQLEEANRMLEDANESIEEKEQEIQDLMAKLASSQSSQSQGEYDLTAKEQELEELLLENKELMELCDQLEVEIEDLEDAQKTLEAALEAARPYKVKADFMDSYVVFVENNGSNLYHTYDCSLFSKSNFWAYSRKLAEAQGFNACPTCGGVP